MQYVVDLPFSIFRLAWQNPHGSMIAGFWIDLNRGKTEAFGWGHMPLLFFCWYLIQNILFSLSSSPQFMQAKPLTLPVHESNWATGHSSMMISTDNIRGYQHIWQSSLANDAVPLLLSSGSSGREYLKSDFSLVTPFHLFGICKGGTIALESAPQHWHSSSRSRRRSSSRKSSSRCSSSSSSSSGVYATIFVINELHSGAGA